MGRCLVRLDIKTCLALIALSCAAASAQTLADKSHPTQQSSVSGASSPVKVSPGDWQQLAKFSESKVYQSCCAEFGTAVGISGDTIVVGDAFYNPMAGYVFVKPVSGWKNATPVASLTVPGSGSVSSGSVAIAGDTVVIGGAAAAYVFVKPAAGWTDMNPTATLTASDGLQSDGFGVVVGISGDTVVVTAPDQNSKAGAAYVFVRPANGWANMTQTAKLTASDGQASDYLGTSASISGSTIALGATQYPKAGKAYVYVKPAGGWADMTQTAALKASDATTGVGISIATNGDDVLVGADGPFVVGAGYMFVKPAGGWVNATETAKLSPADPDSNARFGTSVAVGGNSAVVSAPFRRGGGGVYIFSEPAGGWHSISSATLVNGSDARRISYFGNAVALQDKLLVVGAPLFYFHAAYVFGLP